jgi:hypothetical protein
LVLALDVISEIRNGLIEALSHLAGPRFEVRGLHVAGRRTVQRRAKRCELLGAHANRSTLEGVHQVAYVSPVFRAAIACKTRVEPSEQTLDIASEPPQ